MRLPYVTRATFDAACARADAHCREMARWQDGWGQSQIREEATRQLLADERKRYDDLLEKYHALRSQGFAPIDAHAFPVTDSPLSKLGPLTRAALESNAKGLSRANRAAMENAALSMFAQQIPDESIAEAVRRGETLRKVG